jgi:hypothetical protein
MLIWQENLRDFSDDGSSVCSDITGATNEDTRLNHPPCPPRHVNVGGGVDISAYEKERIVIADHSSNSSSLSIDEMSLVDMPQQQHWPCLNINDHYQVDDHMVFEGRQFFTVGGCDSQQLQQCPSSQLYTLPIGGGMEPQHFLESHHVHNVTQTTTRTMRPIEQRPSTTWPCVQELLDTIVSDESDGEGDNNDDDATLDDILD